MDLSTPTRKLGSIYIRYASALEKLGIEKLEDLLYHIPSRYDDFTLISNIASVQPGETVTIQGTVLEIKNDYTRRIRLQKAKVADETGEIDITWFNQPFIPKVIRQGDRVSLSGKIDIFGRSLVMQSPEYEIIPQNNADPNADRRTIHTGRLVPVYPLTSGLTSKWLRRQIDKLLRENKDTVTEYLPDEIRKNHNLLPFVDALEQVHFPDNLDNVKKARLRLAFDELFLLQLTALTRKKEWSKNYVSNPFSTDSFQKHIDAFLQKLPFTLTNAQKKAVEEIFSDLSKTKPMNRLLEGDVGSGKTVVAAIAMYLAYLNGFQSVLMAPTEILAQQHHTTISNLLSSLGVKIGLATGSKKFQISSIRQAQDKNFKFQILVGTHAVLSEKVNFDNLGLVVIDEQQRFGVEQRAIIRSKGKNPHLLTMTATPIPRTIALTLYGDLDLSYLDEMPKGRKEIKTWLVPQEKRKGAYEWIKKQMKETDSQVFIICPFIEESESMQTVKAATKEFERLQKEVFKEFRLTLLHGKMKSKEKDRALADFKNKKFDILVATPVVEVGIDIPNATIIVIEAAERFGLAQLHQLRGRVGRGEKQSYCLLFTESKSEQTTKRLKAMEIMHHGAGLAEYDLKMRGPGDLFGTKQHGAVSLKVASFSDFTLIQKARTEAEKIFSQLSKYPSLEEKIKKITMKWVSPD